jgi:hypothetical protein
MYEGEVIRTWRSLLTYNISEKEDVKIYISKSHTLSWCNAKGQIYLYGLREGGAVAQQPSDIWAPAWILEKKDPVSYVSAGLAKLRGNRKTKKEVRTMCLLDNTQDWLIDSGQKTFKLHSFPVFFSNGSTALVGLDLPIVKASRSHSDTPHSVEPPGREIGPSPKPLPDNTQHSQQTDIHAPCGIRTHNPSKRATAYPRLRPRAHWDRPFPVVNVKFDFLTTLTMKIF